MLPVSADCLMLVLSDEQARSATYLGTASGLGPVDTLHRLRRLVEQEFVVAVEADEFGPVYRLAPMAAVTGCGTGCRRILLLESDPDIAAVMTILLESEGYAAVVCQTLTDAGRLLDRVRFDLVLTDGFSRTPAGVVAATAGVVQVAGLTPVVLFTAHQMERDAVLAAGFRDLICKPFDLETMLQQVHTLLRTGTPLDACTSVC